MFKPSCRPSVNAFIGMDNGFEIGHEDVLIEILAVKPRNSNLRTLFVYVEFWGTPVFFEEEKAPIQKVK